MMMLRRIKRRLGEVAAIARQHPDGRRASFRLLVRIVRMRLPMLTARLLARPPHVERHGAPIAALLVSGGIGDYIIIARFMRDLVNSCNGLEFYVFASLPTAARWIFGAVPGFRSAHPDTLLDALRPSMDLVLRAHQAVMLEEPVRLEAPISPTLAAICVRLKAQAAQLEPFLRYHPRLDNALARTAVCSNRSRRDYLHSLAGLDYGGDRLALATSPVSKQHGLQPGRYITVHNGYESVLPLANRRATKCYPHFAEVVRLLRARHPELAVVQLGTETSEPIAAATHNLIGRTTIKEAAALLQEARLHLDNESGLVHIASCFGVSCCVVFGPTPADYFGYPHNANIGPPVCGDCWWTTENWMDSCPRGFSEPPCTHAQDPHVVAERATTVLSGLVPTELFSG
jgi:Glycosyltransferase family 9 (heptosyltransferase)